MSPTVYVGTYPLKPFVYIGDDTKRIVAGLLRFKETQCFQNIQLQLIQQPRALSEVKVLLAGSVKRKERHSLRLYKHGDSPQAFLVKFLETEKTKYYELAKCTFASLSLSKLSWLF